VGFLKPTEAINVGKNIDQNRFDSLSKSIDFGSALKLSEYSSKRKIKKALHNIEVNQSLKQIPGSPSSGILKIIQNGAFSSNTQNLKLDFSVMRSSSD
jgi:hypothetical protein